MSRIKTLFAKYFSSSFLKNTAILTSATTLGQLVTLLTAPVLTRIYEPGSYDVLGLYMMVTGLVGTLATLQYHNVIVTAKEESEAKSAVSLCILISLFVAVLTILFVFSFYSFIPGWFNNKEVRVWLLMAPLSVFFTGWTVSLSAYANREQQYKVLSVSRILSAILVPVFSISIGLLVSGPTGLIIGLLVSQIIPAVYLGYIFIMKGSLQLRFQKQELKQISWANRSFVKYSLPSEFINNFINQLPILFFARNYNVSGLIGNFNLSNRLLGMPIQLISTSVSEVFRQKASSEYNEKGNCVELFNKTFKVLALISFVPFLILMVSAPWVFKVVFGEKWVTAGVFSQILAPMFFLKFVVSPLSYIFFVARKQREDFIGHVLMFVLIVASFYIARHFSDNYFYGLTAYSIAYGLTYIYYLYFSYKFSKGK